ncbi:MAG: sugar transferase [Acidimicrobiales bacterium]
MTRLARALVYLGSFAVVLVLGWLHARFIGDYAFLGSSRLAWELAFALILAVAAYGVGLPDVPRNAYVALASATVAAVAGGVGISVVQLGVGSALLPRFVVFWSVLFLIPGWTLCSFLSARGRRLQRRHDRVVAVVARDEAAILESELRRHPLRPASLAAVVGLEEARSQVGASGHVGVESPLAQAVRSSGATVLVLDRAAQADPGVVAQAAELHGRGIRVRTLSLFYDEWLGKLPVSELEQVSLMFDIGEVHRTRYGRLKRVVDISAGILALAVLVVAVPVVIVVDLAGNRGPLFYRQERVGKGGQAFTILKFRTMVTPPLEERPSSAWTTENDPRIGLAGRWLRRLHVDELPQAVNILRGELSLVGPRPEQVGYVAELVDKIPFYGLRHLVRPGLTGWAQVNYAYGSTEHDAVEKLQYEFFYLRHQGLGLDARIVGRTIRHVLLGGGR